jgi:hypothetical protein
MNYRAAGGRVSNTPTKRVHSKPVAMNPQQFKFAQVLRASLWAVSEFYSKRATSRAKAMARGRYRRQREYP